MTGPLETLPLVTVVIPCRNESSFIGECLASVVASRYPKDRLEVLVVDGASDDGTRHIAEDFARRYPWIRVLPNPRRITPVGLNLGIRQARGRFILWMGAHSRYAADYIPLVVQYLLGTPADNVGGVMVTVPRNDTALGRALAAALSHPFGVGNSYFRIASDTPRWVDTVFGGGYRRAVFEEVGLFNERLVRGQDLEFNLRLRRAGKRILLVPSIRSYYYARTTLLDFWRHNWRNGVWAILPFLYSATIPVTWRHVAPLGFVMSAAGLTLAGFRWRPAWWLLGLAAAAYMIASLAAACQIAWIKRDVRYLVLMPVAFASLHLGYGLGSFAGLVLALGRWLAHGRQVPPVERL